MCGAHCIGRGLSRSLILLVIGAVTITTNIARGASSCDDAPYPPDDGYCHYCPTPSSSYCQEWLGSTVSGWTQCNIQSYVDGYGQLVYECNMTGSICYWNPEPESYSDCELYPVYESTPTGFYDIEDTGLELRTGSLTAANSTGAEASPFPGGLVHLAGTGDAGESPVLVTLAPGVIGAFVHTNAGTIDMWRHTVASGWTLAAGDTSINGGAPENSIVGAVNWNPSVEDRVDVFVIGQNHDVLHTWKSGGSWGGSESLGGYVNRWQPPAVASRGVGLMDVVVRGTDDQIWWNKYDNGWSGWQPIGGSAAGPPAITSTDPNTLNVAYISTSGTMDTAQYDASTNTWSGWKGVPTNGGQFGSTWTSPRDPYNETWTFYQQPALVAVSPSHFVAFANGLNGNAWVNEYDRYYGEWSGWANLGLQWPGGTWATATGIGQYIALAGTGPFNNWGYRLLPDGNTYWILPPTATGSYTAHCETCTVAPWIGYETGGQILLQYAIGDAMNQAVQYTPSGYMSEHAPVGGYRVRRLTGGRNADGTLQSFMVGLDSQIYTIVQTSPGHAWGGLNYLTTPDIANSARELSAGTNPDGRLEVFYTAMDNKLYHAYQVAPNGGWTREMWYSGFASRAVVVDTDAAGCLNVFTTSNDPGTFGYPPNQITNDRMIYQTFEATGCSYWTSMHYLNGSLSDPGARTTAKELASAKNADGRLELFYIGLDNKVGHTWQTTPTPAGGSATQSWSSHSSLVAPPGIRAKHIAVGKNFDGRLELFYIGMDDVLYHTWQTSSNQTTAWGSGVPLGIGKQAKQVSVGTYSDGRLDVFYVAPDDMLYHVWQAVPGGQWHEQLPLFTYATYEFNAYDSRGWTADGDWAVNELKGECGRDEWATGVSTGGSPTNRPYSLLCNAINNSHIVMGGHTLDIRADNDGYGSSTNWDWDPGTYKAECRSNERVTGMSRTSSGALGHVRCTGWGGTAHNCRTKLVSERESPGDLQDWAPFWPKIECRQGAAIVGVSRDESTGGVHSLLCCDVF